MNDKFQFWWNDMSSEAFGLMVQKQPPVSRAKERVSTVTIPGRSGTLTLLQGDDVYEPVTKTVTCAIKEGADLAAISDWLRGTHMVRFGNDPEFQYEARVANQADIQHLFNNGWSYQMNIPFYCQPLKLSYPVESNITVNSGDTVTNIGTVASKPIFRLTISSTAQTDADGYVSDITFTVSKPGELTGNAIVITKVKPGDIILVDWYNGDCSFFTTRQNANNHIIGNPQRLAVGENTVSWSGAISSCVLTPNWRWA